MATWRSYLPDHVVRALLAAEGSPPLGVPERFDAVALFADVSGFTAMSEALGTIGRQGSEELTLILNGYFEPMIALIESFGGIVGKFGGDALTVLFPYTKRTRAAVARRSAWCALAMQAESGRFASVVTSAGDFSLAMKVGLARSGVLCTLVGVPEIRLEYIIAGPCIDACADAEHRATKGEVVVHDDLLADLTPLPGSTPRDGFTLLAGLAQPARPAPLHPTAASDATLAAIVAPFLHPILRDRIAADQHGFINEHRQVTVLFVRFAGFDYADDPAAAAKLQDYLSAVVQTVARYDGFLNRVDMGDKGSKYIVLLGAPVAHEDDAERAVRCALELLALPVEAQIGINTGFVYCGLVGSATRQEYTVMGDPVNLAARLMQAAQPGQILAGSSTWQAAPRAFDWVPLPPISVKGKRAPVDLYAPRGLADPAATPAAEDPALPLVGRRKELARALVLLDRAGRGAGQVIALSAEAGMGKTRLAAAVAAVARARNFAVLNGAGRPHGSSSYEIWRSVWRGFFGLNPDWDGDTQRAHLERTLLALDWRLAPRAPLLAGMLQISIPDTDLTRSLDPALRDTLTKSLLLECLRARSRSGAPPLLIVLEDCHWIDPLSQELLELLGRALADLRVALLLAYRPPATGEPLAWARGAAHVSELPLTDLAPEEAAALARLAFAQRFAGTGEPPAALVERVVARAQGHPLYLEETINYIYSRGVAPNDEAALDQLDLPDTLHRLILSRIDQLSATEQATIKSASVIGPRFRSRWLVEGYPQLGSPADVARHLQTLSGQELTPLERRDPEPEYGFRHALMQEVAYQSMSFASRATLHEQLADYVETRYADDRGAYLDVLAYHYGRSHNQDRQRIYFRLAGDAAAVSYANAAATDYYERLLPLLEAPDQAPVLHRLGEIGHLTGQWETAEAHCRRALVLAEAAGDQRTAAYCRQTIGALLGRTQSYEAAMPWLEQARTAFADLGDTAGLTRTLEQLSFASFQLGDTERALEQAQLHLTIATDSGDALGRSDALAQIGLVAFQRGDSAGALQAHRQARELADQIGYRRRAVLSANDMAGVYWQLGDPAHALEWLLEGLQSADEIGYTWVAGLMIGNAGLLYAQQGEDDRALACLGRSLQTASDLGDGPGVVLALGRLAELLGSQGQTNEAAALCERAVIMARQLGLNYELAEYLALLADLERQRGHDAVALPLCDEAVALAERSEAPEVAIKGRALRERLRLTLGLADTAAACATLETLLTQPDDAAQALIHDTLWQLDATRSHNRDSAAALYRALYAAAPKAEYRARYAALTGEDLPPPPPLPALPPQFAAPPDDLPKLFARVGVGQMMDG